MYVFNEYTFFQLFTNVLSVNQLYEIIIIMTLVYLLHFDSNDYNH